MSAATVGALFLVQLSCRPESPRAKEDPSLQPPPAEQPRDAGDSTSTVWVTNSEPRLNASSVYPAPIASGMASGVRLSATFSVVMKPSATLTLQSDDIGKTLQAKWSTDGKMVEALVESAPFTGEAPLKDDTRYRLNLSSLEGERGEQLVDGDTLLNGALVFRTGRRDALLNHSCGHVALGPFKEVTASPFESPLSPRSDVPHTRYTVALSSPVDGGSSFSGFTRFEPSAKATFTLFFEDQSPFEVLSEDGTRLTVEQGATQAACAGITWKASFVANQGQQLTLHFQPSARNVVRMIVEASFD